MPSRQEQANISDYTKVWFTSTEDPDRSVILTLSATPEQLQEAMQSIGAEAKSGMVDMPEKWKAAMDCEKLGMIAAELERGAFAAHGYALPSGDEWTPHFEKSRTVPEAYRITDTRPSVRARLKAEN